MSNRLNEIVSNRLNERCHFSNSKFEIRISNDTAAVLLNETIFGRVVSLPFSSSDVNGSSSLQFRHQFKNKNVQRHTIRKLWKIHFSMGLIVLCLGMMCNGGRYVARPMDDRRNTFYAQCNDSNSF